MSDLLKQQQAFHANNTKWNQVLDKIKKYETNATIGFIIDDIVKGEFVDEDK